MPDPSHIKDLIEDPKNRRDHSSSNIGMIADALQAVGAARSIVIDEDNVVMAGNGVVEAAGQVGITKVRTVDAEGDEIIAVRRRNLTPDQKRTLALYDNRASELAEWNLDQLREDQAAGVDLTPFFDDKELTAMLDDGPPVKPIVVPRAAEIVWVLLAVPMATWPTHQAAIEALQLDAQFSAMVVRPKGDDD